MRRREYQHNEDQLSFAWQTPRPLYMREIEPLAHDGAWPSPLTIDAPSLTSEQTENREIFMAALNRKRPAATGSQKEERKTG
jgi:hypothetical protein